MLAAQRSLPRWQRDSTLDQFVQPINEKLPLSPLSEHPGLEKRMQGEAWLVCERSWRGCFRIDFVALDGGPTFWGALRTGTGSMCGSEASLRTLSTFPDQKMAEQRRSYFRGKVARREEASAAASVSARTLEIDFRSRRGLVCSLDRSTFPRDSEKIASRCQVCRACPVSSIFLNFPSRFSRIVSISRARVESIFADRVAPSMY